MIARTPVPCPHCGKVLDARVVVNTDGSARIELVGEH